MSAELALVDNDSGKKQHGAYMIVTLKQLESMLLRIAQQKQFVTLLKTCLA